MSRSKLSSVLLKRLLWFMLVLPGAVTAGAAEWKPGAPQPSAFAEKQVSLEEAIARVQKKHGGRIVAATPIRRDGKSKYRIRIDVDGRVKTFFVDAKGRISGR